MERSSLPMDIGQLDHRAWQGSLGRRSVGTEGVAVALRAGPLGTLGREHRCQHAAKTLGVRLQRNRQGQLATLCGYASGGCEGTVLGKNGLAENFLCKPQN